MNIREIRVEGFGSLRDRTIALEGPATVFYGPNEAGKSTLLHLIRAVLFGFPPRGQAAERFEPVGGGAHGGALTLETDQGERVRVARRSGDAAPGRGRAPSGGIVSVTLADGTTGGEELLRELLGGVTGEQFKNLFAFTLTELQELRTLTSGELGGFLHSAGLGVRAAAVTAAERRLAQELDARFKPRGRNQGIGRLLADADGLAADWRRSLANVGRYNDMAAELDRLAEEIAAAEDKLRGERGRLGFLQSAAQVRDRWLRLHTIRQELAELPERSPFPEDGLSRQEELLQELERRTARLAQLESVQGELEARIRAYTDEDRRLLDQRVLLEGLLERLVLYKNGFVQELEWTTEQERLEEQLRGKLAGLGLGDDPREAAALGVPVTLEHQAEAKRWKELAEEGARRRHVLLAEREGLDRSLREAEERAADRLAELEAHRKRLERLYPADARELAPALPGMIRELRRDLQEAASLKRDLLLTEERELEHRLQLEEQQAAAGTGAAPAAVPALAWLGLAALASAVGAAVLFAVRGEWPLAAGSLALLGGLGGAVLTVGRTGRGTRGAAAAASRSARPFPAVPAAESPLAMKRRELSQRLEAVRERIRSKLQGFAFRKETAAAGAFSGPRTRLPDGDPEDGSLPELLEQWASDLLKDLQEEERLEERWQETVRSAASLHARRQQADRELVGLDRESAERLAAWRQWLARWGVQPELPPGFAPDLLAHLVQAQELAARSGRIAAQRTALREERRRFEAECGSLLGLGEPSPASNGQIPENLELPALLQNRKQETERASERYTRMKEAAAALEQLRLERQEEEQAAERTMARLAGLWSAAGAADAEAFRRLGADAERARRLEDERKTLCELLAAAVGAERLEELEDALARYGERELAEELRRSGHEEEELAERLDRMKERKGQLAAECAGLLEGSEHGERRDRMEELMTRFRDEASQYAIYALAAGLLRKARESYERERQPGVLRQASAHFSRMTGGRYERVMAPFGEQRLVAMRADGEGVDSSRLSRGTAEQLYLSIRFALAAEFARKTPLPLILDDIFVNFDRERLEAAVRELGHLSAQHQILVFTCHPHVLEAMQRILPHVQAIEV